VKARRRHDNRETLFGVSQIPCDNKIRELIDSIEPEALSGVFMDSLQTAEEAGVLKEYRVLDRRMNRFSLRTKKKVNIQRLLYFMVHIGKCMPRIPAERGVEGESGGLAKNIVQRTCRQ
jgi:hypothetical protein